VIGQLPGSADGLGALYGPIACGVLVCAPSGAVAYANAAAEELLGLCAAVMVGRQPAELWATVGEDGQALGPTDQPAALALHTGRPVRQRTLGILRPDGTARAAGYR
jgi:PAS domain-containing protein